MKDKKAAKKAISRSAKAGLQVQARPATLMHLLPDLRIPRSPANSQFEFAVKSRR